MKRIILRCLLLIPHSYPALTCEADQAPRNAVDLTDLPPRSIGGQVGLFQGALPLGSVDGQVGRIPTVLPLGSVDGQVDQPQSGTSIRRVKITITGERGPFVLWAVVPAGTKELENTTHMAYFTNEIRPPFAEVRQDGTVVMKTPEGFVHTVTQDGEENKGVTIELAIWANVYCIVRGTTIYGGFVWLASRCGHADLQIPNTIEELIQATNILCPAIVEACTRIEGIRNLQPWQLLFDTALQNQGDTDPARRGPAEAAGGD